MKTMTQRTDEERARFLNKPNVHVYKGRTAWNGDHWLTHANEKFNAAVVVHEQADVTVFWGADLTDAIDAAMDAASISSQPGGHGEGEGR